MDETPKEDLMDTTNSAVSTACQWCGGVHSGHCPEVKSIDYYENGTIKRVEFYSLAERSPAPLQQVYYPAASWGGWWPQHSGGGGGYAS